MRYPRLVHVVSAKAGTDYQTADRVLKEFANTVKEVVLEKNEEVGIPTFGKFWPRKVQARDGHSFGDRVVNIPAQTKVAFRASGSASKAD